MPGREGAPESCSPALGRAGLRDSMWAPAGGLGTTAGRQGALRWGAGSDRWGPAFLFLLLPHGVCALRKPANPSAVPGVRVQL